MPTHVYANNNEIAAKASDGKAIAGFPDVCFTPPSPPVGPLPLPYPNTGEAADTDKGTAKVFIADKMAGMEKTSCFSKSKGDEAATQGQGKGFITGALQGASQFGLWSMNVKTEGAGVPRHMDMVTHNHASDPPNGAMSAFLAKIGLASTCDGVLFFYGWAAFFSRQRMYCGDVVNLYGIGHETAEGTKPFIIYEIPRAATITVESENTSLSMWYKMDWTLPPGTNLAATYSINIDNKNSEAFRQHQKLQLLPYKKAAQKVTGTNYQCYIQNRPPCPDKIAKKIPCAHSPQKTPDIAIKYNYAISMESDRIKIVQKFHFTFFDVYYFASAREYASSQNEFITRCKANTPQHPKLAKFFQEIQRKGAFAGSNVDTVLGNTWIAANTWGSDLRSGSYPFRIQQGTSAYTNYLNSAKALLGAVQNRYNKYFYAKRTNCVHGNKCACKFPLKFYFLFEPDPAKADMQINIYKYAYQADSGSWGLNNNRPPNYAEGSWSHEIGHNLSWYDEYEDVCVETRADSRWVSRPAGAQGMLMCNNDYNHVRKVYGKCFENWINRSFKAQKITFEVFVNSGFETP